MNTTIRDLCRKLLELEFTAHPSDQDAADSGTGINVSMLRQFLLEQLPGMVAAAYANSSASDVPPAALEAYAPRDSSNRVLPSAANNFRWSGTTCYFDLNVTNCPAGDYFIGIQIMDQDCGHDREESGQDIPSLLGRDTDEEVSSDFRKITIGSVDANGSGRQYMPIEVPVPAADGDTYVLVSSDIFSNVIGRSSTFSERTRSNAAEWKEKRRSKSEA